MLNDPDLRNVADDLGDFVGFELFDGESWKPFGVSRTALRILGGPNAETDLDTFERHVAQIKGVAFRITYIGNGRTILNSEHFA